jgi:hypothetical protein
MIKNTHDLRVMLLETMTGLKSGKIGIKEAAGIKGLASAVLQAANLDLKATQFERKYGDSIRSSTPLVSESSDKKRISK